MGTQPGGMVSDRSLHLRQDATATEVDQNVPINMMASNAARSLVSFHFLHTEPITP